MGDVAFGRNRTFGYLVEGTAGSYVAANYNEAFGSPTLKGLYFLEAEFVPNIEIMKEQSMSGRPELITADLVQGIRNYTLRVKMKLPKEGLGWLLFGLFGKVVTTGAASPYTHTFSPSLTSPYPPSFKLQFREPLNTTQAQWQLRGAKIKSMLFEFTNNRMPTVTIDFIGGSFELAAALGDIPTILVPASGNPFWVNADRISTEPNLQGEVADFSSYSFTIENIFAEDIDDSYSIGISTPPFLEANERKRLERASTEECIKFTGTFKRIWPNANLYTLWQANSVADFADELDEGIYQFLPYSYTGRIVKVSHVEKGMGLIEETADWEALYANPGYRIAIKDTQATPATEGT